MNTARGYGQGQSRLTPSVAMTQEYDSNVFASATDPQADFLTRASVGLAADYVAARWNASSGYVHDIEQFANHPGLSTANARQRATVAIGYQPTARTSWAADAEFWKTLSPGELNESTGLTLTRASARRAAAHSAIRHRLDRLTSGTIDYTVTHDTVSGRTDATTHDASVGIERRRTARTTLTMDYRFRQFFFTTPSAASPFATTSHAMTFGWTRAMTPRVRFTVDGGPRLTNTSLAPEVAASVHYQSAGAELTLAYARAQTTVIGLANVAETQSLGGIWTWPVRRSLTLRVAPTFFRTEVTGSRVDAWVLSADLNRPIARGLALDLSVNASSQRGGLNLPLTSTTIARQVVMLRLIAGSSSLLR